MLLHDYPTMNVVTLLNTKYCHIAKHCAMNHANGMRTIVDVKPCQKEASRSRASGDTDPSAQYTPHVLIIRIRIHELVWVIDPCNVMEFTSN